jgi:hypothetical protein
VADAVAPARRSATVGPAITLRVKEDPRGRGQLVSAMFLPLNPLLPDVPRTILAFHTGMADPTSGEHELTEAEKRDNVVRLAFGGDPARLEHFVDIIREYLPEDTGVVLRGSAVTGFRWKDGAPFDSDGEGTSDLDLTLVGVNILDYFKVTGFFVPGVHSRPLSDDDPDIAPELVPLRQRLMDMVHRPVNIQGTRDFVMYLRGELIGQPYLTLIDKPTDDQ